MTTIPETPMPASDRLVSAIDEYTKGIEAELKTVRAENAQINRQLDSTTNEAGLLREQLKDMTAKYDAVRSYATRLDTKLDSLVDIIGGVKAEAMKFGAKKFGAIEATADDQGDIGSIGSILSRLPANALSTN